MKDMEQPIAQTFEMENVDEKLFDVGVEGNTAEIDGEHQKTVSQITDNGSINLGKFKDVESLLKAYNSLQTEFTKKSQKLSELENSNTEFTREERLTKAIKQLEQNHNIATRFSNEIKTALQDKETGDYETCVKDELIKNLAKTYKTADEYIADEEFLNKFVYSNKNIRDNIIRDYLTSLTNITPVKVMSNISGSIPVSPPNIPTTIKDAGRLAKNIIKQI